MPRLRPMPAVVPPRRELAQFGARWAALGNRLSRSKPFSSGQLGNVIDHTVGHALAEMLGGIPVMKPKGGSLTPPGANVVEVGPMRVEGGIRPQNFDVGYRPSGYGVRFAFDSKTLNDTKSVGKNWQNMVNDIATEAATVHSVFEDAVVGFIIAVPFPCINDRRRTQMIGIFENLARRVNTSDQHYLAEAISFVLWNPSTGTINSRYPPPDSPLRIEKFSTFVERSYRDRFDGRPPHDTD